MLRKFKYKTATAPNLKSYVGKTVEIDGKPVVIDTIVGNVWKPQFLEINGTHLIGMLRFFAQMNGAMDITEEQFKAFEEMDLHAEKAQKDRDISKKEEWVSE